MILSHATALAECGLASCMQMRIADTLEVISALEHPVPRTCHIGNNTSNNFGWLALAGNTYLAQMEHTLYGVDDHNVPWALLDDRGVVAACYDHRGRPRPALKGLHANQLRHRVERKYRSLYNFGIFADHDGGDLISLHCRLGEQLSREINGSSVVFRSTEVVEMADLLGELVRAFARDRRLDLLFDRWVRTVPGGGAMVLKIREISYPAPGDLRIESTASDVLFEGMEADLVERLRSGLAAVSERLRTGRPLPDLGYPWIAVNLNLVLNCLKEYRSSPLRTAFWHAGASGTHYYSNRDDFRRSFAELVAAVIGAGFLPAGFRLHVIPSYGCQLFATGHASLQILESLVDLWRGYLDSRREAASACIARLEHTTRPLEVVEDFVRSLDASVAGDLRRRLDAFNAADANRLPVAYFADVDHPTYNKYGVSQGNLLGREISLPSGLPRLTWGELELLVKTLAHLTAGDRW